MIDERFDKMVDYVIENFDFEKVHSVMKFLNWSWHAEGVPKIQTIILRSREMLIDTFKRSIKENKSFTIASGGFRCYCEKYIDDNGAEKRFLHMEFILTDCDADEEYIDED